MELESVLQELAALGTEQNRKIYRRHGVGDNQFGVSFGNLNALRKKLKTNHALALGLWASGNHDARVLAAMLADPKQADDTLLETWARDLDCYPLTDALVGYATKTPLARSKAEAWYNADDEWLGSAAWQLLAHLAINDAALPDSFFEPYLDEIATSIHARKNRVRYQMNNALIAIGARNENLQARALAIAAQIGLVDVDHGETNCKTPDAADYIRKTVEHRAKKKAA